jgi:geranylgeranyl pyrophosphate synthase
MEFGVQMVAMCFQTQDQNLKIYQKTFDTHGFAFQLKKPDLRYKVVTAEEPKKISEDLSYGYKTYETNHYNFNL